MQFELYNITFACGTEWKPNNEYNKADILEDLQVIDPAFYYVINMGVSGCQVSPYPGDVSDIKKPFYSLAALLISYLDSSSFIALVSVGSGAYYLKVEGGLINASSDRILEQTELELFVEGIAEQTSGDIFIDNKLSEFFPDNTDDDDFENFENGIKSKFKKGSFRYIQLKGKASYGKIIFQVLLLLFSIYVFLWMFDLLDYVGLGSKKESVALKVGKSEEQKRLERRELMKAEVIRSLLTDTNRPLPADMLKACDAMHKLDVNSLGGWVRTSSQCRAGQYFANYVRGRGHATSMNFESIVLERYPGRVVNINEGLAGVSTDVVVSTHAAVERSYLPERPVLDVARSFYETRKDIFLNVRLKDNLQKELSIIYENVSYPVDADLNYSSAKMTFSKVPLHVFESIIEIYNHQYAVVDGMTFIDRLVTAELTIYYK
jgi:hypothetical protein